jgi:hypothetical protein
MHAGLLALADGREAGVERRRMPRQPGRSEGGQLLLDENVITLWDLFLKFLGRRLVCRNFYYDLEVQNMLFGRRVFIGKIFFGGMPLVFISFYS